MPNKNWVSLVYFLASRCSQLAKWLESSVWGYAWCKSCNGTRVYPNSGLWCQPDGYHLCPDCKGSRWYHCTLHYNSIFPSKCYCYLRGGKDKSEGIVLVSSIYSKKIPHSVSCSRCKRKVSAKEMWLAVLKWNGPYYYTKDNIKFLRDNYYTSKGEGE